jgi:hypothetical protein
MRDEWCSMPIIDLIVDDDAAGTSSQESRASMKVSLIFFDGRVLM